MENDVLSSMTMNDETRSITRKIFGLSLVLVICAGLYSAFGLFEWYLVLRRTMAIKIHSSYYFYSNILKPISFFLIAVLSLIAYTLNFKGYRAINAGIDNQDQIFVNKGFKNIFTAMWFSIIAFVFAMLTLSYEILMIRKILG